jgi:hypothetical protein
MTNYQKYKLIIFICVSALSLLILNNYSSNGRYVMREETLIILDTRTGTVYIPQNRKFVELNDFTKMEQTDEDK